MSSTTTVLVSTFSPFPSLAFDAPSETAAGDVLGLLASRFPHLPLQQPSLVLSTTTGPIEAGDSRPLSALHVAGSSLLSFRLTPRLLGGKGGFGSQLRAAGGRMSSQKTSNNDSCRDLSGRRLSTVKEATKIAAYIESEAARKQADKEAAKAKLEALERQLGIDPTSTPGAGSSKSIPPEAVAGKKHRFDDTEYIEQSRDIVDEVKSAVAAGFLKKRKKAKLDAAPVAANSSEPSEKPVVSKDVAANSTSSQVVGEEPNPLVVAAEAAAVTTAAVAVAVAVEAV
ncbi:hypothetical protein DL93DRAFT_2071427 [Clavulina sp. PMI_390]|nr:hypothetical protein DL93DRAFT_2071427 [Clavulina sp. PMI_390]